MKKLLILFSFFFTLHAVAQSDSNKIKLSAITKHSGAITNAWALADVVNGSTHSTRLVNLDSFLKKADAFAKSQADLLYADKNHLHAGVYLTPADTVNKFMRLSAGSNVSITGSYPNLTISSTGGGGGSATLYSTTGTNTDGAMTQAATTTALSNKVDKVGGKQLSTEDYTTAEKNKLAAITGTNTGDETGASIKIKLEALSGSNRLDASAIKNLPSGGSADSTTFATQFRLDSVKANIYAALGYKVVTQYGAKGDGTYKNGAAMTSGSASLTVSSGSFTSADIGKYIEVGGAGAAAGRLVTTISAVTNANTVTLAATASTTVSGQRVLYGTDNTTAFQAAINATYSAADTAYNGKVFVPKGRYLFTAAPIVFNGTDSVNNAQIYLPTNGTFASVNRVGTVEIEGEVAPNMFTDYTNRQVGVVESGVILQSTLNDSTSCLFGNAFSKIGPSCAFSNQSLNYTQLHLKNLRFRVNSTNGTTYVANRMTAVNLEFTAMSVLQNLVVDNETPSYLNIIGAGSWGIKKMPYCNWALQRADNVCVTNYDNGYMAVEHEEASAIYVANCTNGLVIAENKVHGAHLGRVLIQWCVNNVKIAGKAIFTIDQLILENQPGNLYDIYEPVLSNSIANIRYNFSEFLSPPANGLKISTLSSGIILNKIGTGTSTGTFVTVTGGGGGSSSGDVLAEDDFNRANSTSTAGNLITPNTPWTAESGTWGIESNKLYCVSETTSGAANTYYLTHDVGVSDYTVETDVTLLDGSLSSAGIALRRTDASNGIFLFIVPSGSLLYKQVGGSYSAITGGTQQGGGNVNPANTPATYKVTVSGSTYQIYKNNTLIATVTESFNSTATNMGLLVESGTDKGGGVRFDNFKVTQ
ncbi:MAG: hypothetical protein EOO14_00350 [Chitinophagaceae bacterium]|nr:MAG: hypothetical protein EOO14_00350 [Chitinophagaceae bacterium]